MTSKPSKNAVMLSPVDLERVLGSTMDAKWQDVLSLGLDGKINEACELAAILLAKSTHLLMLPMTEDKEVDLEIIDGLIKILAPHTTFHAQHDALVKALSELARIILVFDVLQESF